MDQTHNSKPGHSAKMKTVDADQVLRRMAPHQTPLQVPHVTLDIHCVENYFLLLSALEDNLAQFKRLVDTLAEVSVWCVACVQYVGGFHHKIYIKSVQKWLVYVNVCMVTVPLSPYLSR